MPLGMSDAQAVVLGDKVYIGGGDSTHHSQAVLLIYDYSNDSWETLDTPTVNYALTTYNSQLVLVGGRDPNSKHVTNQLWALDEQWQWTQSLPPMTTGRSWASAVSMDHYLIVAGGHDEHILDVVEVYDGQYWRKVQSIPKASCSMKSCLLKGIWYLAGGEEHTVKTFGLLQPLFHAVISVAYVWYMHHEVQGLLPVFRRPRNQNIEKLLFN